MHCGWRLVRSGVKLFEASGADQVVLAMEGGAGEKWCETLGS